MDEVKNKVYYNCEDADSNGVSYGADNYDYASSCELWRIIGVFDIKSSTSETVEKRIKLINTASTFTASWDSSEGGWVEEGNCIGINCGYGINQWGPSEDYEGADPMRLLNGYYIGEDTSCTYCNNYNQSTCSNECISESLASTKMKPLTNKAKSMIGNAVWDTYAVSMPEDKDRTSNWAPTAYLEEKGISAQNTGKMCSATNSDGSENKYCNDNVIRTTSWTGLVGLMSISDMVYANGWLYDQGNYKFSWSISPEANRETAYYVWVSEEEHAARYYTVSSQLGVFSSVYLKYNIQIIGGNGNDKPYILK